MAQPEALAVMVTAVLDGCGEPGATDAVSDVQGVVASVYAKPGTNESLQPRLLHEVPELAASRAQTEKR